MSIDKREFLSGMGTWIVEQFGVRKEDFHPGTNLIEAGILDSLKLLLFFSEAEKKSGAKLDPGAFQNLTSVTLDAVYGLFAFAEGR
jgi:acyl carrier protein